MIFLGNTLVLVPVLLRGLGKEQFALLALVTPFLRCGFNGVFDLGIATGIVRYISRSFAADDSARVNEYVSSGIVLYVLLGTLLAGSYYAFAPFLLHALTRGNGALYVPAQVMMSRFVWVYALSCLSNPFFAVLMGVQKVEVTHWVGTISLILELCGVLALLPGGLTLPRLMWVYGVNGLATLAVCMFLAGRYFPPLKLSLEGIRKQRIREILRYGTQFSATVMATILSPVVDKVILARYVGLTEVALYEVAARLVELLRRATQLLLLPLMPMAGTRGNLDSESETERLYSRAFEANLLVSCGLYLIPAALAFGIFRVWLGQGSRLAAIAFVTLCGVAFCQALVGPLSMTLLGVGRLKPLMATAVIAIGLNVFVSRILAGYFGFQGVLAGTVVAYGFVSLALLIWSAGIPVFHIPGTKMLRLGGFAAVIGLLPGTAMAFFLPIEGQHSAWRALLPTVIVACASFITFSLFQQEYRLLIFRMVTEVREGIKMSLNRSPSSNA
ncbi:MAG TPA: oligosaccharide flippase family protein [Candidatus Acidoferrum sp.]